MGLSKVYRGFVIEDVNGQYYIHNAPNYTNGFPFSPGPHGGWTVATHQVDKLIEYMNRDSDHNNQSRNSYDSYDSSYSPGSGYSTPTKPKEWEEMNIFEKFFGFVFGLVFICIAVGLAGIILLSLFK